MKRIFDSAIMFVALAFIAGSCVEIENELNPPETTGEMMDVELRLNQPGAETKSHFGEKNEDTGTYPVYWDAEGESVIVHEHVWSAEKTLNSSSSKNYTLSEDARLISFEGLQFEVNTDEEAQFGYSVTMPSSAVTRFFPNNQTNYVAGYISLPKIQKPTADGPDRNAAVLVGYMPVQQTQQTVIDVDMKHIMAYAKMTIRNFDCGNEKPLVMEFRASKNIYANQFYYLYQFDSHGTLQLEKNALLVDLSSLENKDGTLVTHFCVISETLTEPFAAGDTFTISITTDSKVYTKTYTMTEEQKLDFKTGVLTTFSVNFDGVEGADLIPPSNEIWYQTSTANAITDEMLASMKTDQEIESHTYENGIGKVRYAGDISELKDYFLSGIYGNPVIAIYIPDCVSKFGNNVLNNMDLTSLRLPESLSEVGTQSMELPKLSSFTGGNGIVSQDGRCIIINDELVGFASAGITEYTIPDGVRKIGWGAFNKRTELKSIVMPDSVTEIGQAAFYGCSSLETITLSSSLNTIGSAIFMLCDNLKAFYGDSPYRTEDYKCFIIPSLGNREEGSMTLRKFAGGGGDTEYTIPDGIHVIDVNAFVSPTLKKVTLNNDIVEVMGSAFTGCTAFEGIYGPNTSADHRFIQFGSELRTFAVPNGLTEYHIPDDITSIGYSAFKGIPGIKKITMGDQVVSIGGYTFNECDDLEEVILSAGLKKIGDDRYSGYTPFINCRKLKKVYFRSLTPPAFYYGNEYFEVNQDLVVYVPEGYIDYYKRDDGWYKYHDHMTEYAYTDLPETDYYISTDFSKDLEVVTLQEAAATFKMDGTTEIPVSPIPVVLLGDGFTDKYFDGTDTEYHDHMVKLYDALFSIEPLKSFKDLFTVKYVKAVSPTELGFGATALGVEIHDDNRSLTGNLDACIEYAGAAFPTTHQDDMFIITLANKKTEAVQGTSFMLDPISTPYRFATGAGIAFCTISDTHLDYVIQHEAVGHAFAKLADEYVTMDKTVPDSMKEKEVFENLTYGWWSNISYSADDVPWACFMEDDLYADEGIGIYEGAAEYAKGVWKSTESSIMSSSTDLRFNAQSRYAICQKLWVCQYGYVPDNMYDLFVAYDAINRTPAEEQE